MSPEDLLRIRLKGTQKELRDLYTPRIIKGPWWTIRSLLIVGFLQLYVIGSVYVASIEIQRRVEFVQRARGLVCDYVYFRPYLIYDNCEMD